MQNPYPQKAITEKGIIQKWYYLGEDIKDVPSSYLSWAVHHMDAYDDLEFEFMRAAEEELRRRDNNAK